MRIITNNGDNVVVMYSANGQPEAAADQTPHDLTEAQAESFLALLAQPNGGVTFDGELFAALPAPAPPKPRAMCSAWQFRKELRERNMLEDVIQLVANSGVDAQEAFDYASEFWSDNPMLLGLAASLPTPLTESEVYDMIVSASKRVVGTA